MRALIVGQTGLNNTKAAIDIVSNEDQNKWTVITSFTANETMWRQRGFNVTLFQDLKDTDLTNHKLILDVLAASFYDKEVIVTKIAKDCDIIVLTTLPNEADIVRFKPFDLDSIYITLTKPMNKLMHIHRLIETHLSAMDFCKAVKGLTADHYLQVTRERKVKIMTIGAAQSQDDSKSQSKSDMKPETTVSQPKCPVLVQSCRTPAKKVERPDTEDYWVCWSCENDATVKTTLQLFKDMMSSNLITAMYTMAAYESIPLGISVYFQVSKQRQDLFVALTMNVLQALRNDGFILQGSIAIV